MSVKDKYTHDARNSAGQGGEYNLDTEVILTDAQLAAVTAAVGADATQALADAATADGKAVSAQGDATQALSDASTADGKAVTADGKAVTAQAAADAAAVERVSFESGIVEWEDVLSTEEIYRTVLPAGKKFELNKVELQLKGGGTLATLKVDVYNVTLTAIMGTQVEAGSVITPDVQSGIANTIIFRITNSSGAVQNANIIIRGKII